MEIVCRLNVILAERGIKKTYLAKKSGINNGTLSRLVSNQSLPSLDVAYRIAEELDLNVMEIWVKKNE